MTVVATGERSPFRFAHALVRSASRPETGAGGTGQERNGTRWDAAMGEVLDEPTL